MIELRNENVHIVVDSMEHAKKYISKGYSIVNTGVVKAPVVEKNIVNVEKVENIVEEKVEPQVEIKFEVEDENEVENIVDAVAVNVPPPIQRRKTIDFEVLEKLTLDELKSFAKIKKVKGFSTMTKPEILNALKEIL